MLAHGQASDKSEPTKTWLVKAAKLGRKVGEPALMERAATWLTHVAGVQAPQFSVAVSRLCAA